jgi:type VI secretion system protein ImpL
MTRSLAARWVLSFIGTALLAAILWFFGPLLGALEPVGVRAAIVVVMLLLWGGVNWFIDRRNSRRDAALATGITKADPKLAASAEEVAALQDRLSGALTLLRQARGTRGYLYEQPWYIIIGPPGAGKTTALLNAGLRFPLAAEAGHAVPGVGGTRFCDWWFTDEAVLIDTAGRYTTQDSDAAVDRAGWEGFLDLLKRTRVRQPLNGVIVAIAIPDIAQADRDARLAHARAVRRRVKEVMARLGVRVPVYAVFTKADLRAGFTEFFDDLDSEGRAQVWGRTFELSSGGEGGVLANFPADFDALVRRLDDRLFARLQAERSPDRRALLAGFPAQMASLEQPLAEFLAEAFGGSRLDPAPLLRGVYFSSGTQEGTPIDRLTGSLARTFGVDQRRAPSLKPQRGRSYFLQRLLKDVIFNEAMLVSEPPGAARRRWAVRAAGYGGALVLVLAVAGLLWHTRRTGEADTAQSALALAAYQSKLNGIPVDPVADGDLPRVLPVLDAARALPHGYDAPIPAWWSGLGLGQNGKLAIGARTVYGHALDRVFLPRLIWRLEAQMRGNLQRPEFLYEAARVYLMLGGQGPLDPSLVRAWMQLDWANSYPGPANAPVRQDLNRHLDALLAEPLPQIPLDGALVASARAVFSRVPLADRIYSRIRPSAAAQDVPPWRPSDALGPAGVRMFVRASGKPLDEGIPGFFTVAGFHNVLLPSLGRVAQDVAGESWVLGKTASVAPNSPELARIEQGVIQLYEKDYAAQWDAMLADLNIASMRTLQAASQELYVLSSPQSPMRDLLASIARQLTLSQPPPAPPGQAANATGTAVAAAKSAAGAAAPAAVAQLQSLFSTGTQGAAPTPPGKEIDTRFAALREFVGSGPGAPIDGVLKLMSDLQAQLARLAAATPGSPPPAPSGGNPAALLQAASSSTPAPVSRWLATIISESEALQAGGARAEVAAAFTGSGGPADLCRAAVNNRYPFFPGSNNSVPIADFARLFAPGGLLDGFFNTQLRPYVDTSGPVWHARALDGVQPPISAGALAEFQRGAQIRDMFFGSGGTAPQVQFDLTPASLDAGAKQVTLELGTTTIAYSHGPPVATQVTWPGPGGMTMARLVFDPPSSGSTGVIEATGPWALFRLFSDGQLTRQGSADNYTLSFQQGERQASFSLRAGSVLNPFDSRVLQAFRCPALQ